MDLKIAIPVLVILFFLFYRYRKGIVECAIKIRIPKILLALISAVPLITLEEHLNCGAYGCAKVFFPPTLVFLIVCMAIFLVIFKVFKINNLKKQLISYVLFGILMELSPLGAAANDFRSLIFSNPLGFIFISGWVGFSYLFIIYLPLLVLNSEKVSIAEKI